jgi:hypothetical protein
VKSWRLSLWLVPIATLIPLGIFIHDLTTTDFSAYFGNVELAGLIVLLGVPSLLILGASVVGAVAASKGRPLVALAIVAAVCAYQLSPLAWSGAFWDAHQRGPYLVSFALPGTVAGLLGIWGWLLLRNSSRTAVVIAAVLLLAPVASLAAGGASYAVTIARDCPPGPSVDLSVSGLENAHFASSCGIPSGVASLTGCTTDRATVGLVSVNEWFLSFVPYSRTVMSDEFPYWAPDLIVGGNTNYGGGFGWKGSYTFDSRNHCAGTVDAVLFATPGGRGGSVHISGSFEAPQ